MEAYLDRDIGWLRFNERVLFQAEDDRTPLLERVRFINIFQNNLNEFFMKRVGGLLQKKFANLPIASSSGLSVGERLIRIREEVLALSDRVDRLLSDSVLPELKKNQIYLCTWSDLPSEHQTWCREFFKNRIFPVVTPMVVDQGHPFPLLSNLSTSLAAVIRVPGEEELLFARVKLPNYLPEWIHVEDKKAKGEYFFIHLIDIIKFNIQDLFPKMEIEAVMPFKITRNADFETDEDEAEDLLDLIQAEIKNR
ncbi:MAG: polyphosphate kinase 1, partial [Bdellovibrionales bacterium]|nr:polyphosphate kinase 1 [Bdellovibrionales bacterium]